jgi:hypothetical protein
MEITDVLEMHKTERYGASSNDGAVDNEDSTEASAELDAALAELFG